MTQVIQITTTEGHIFALGSDGSIWWKGWEKKAKWVLFEQVPFPVKTSAPIIPTPPVTPPPAA